MAFSPDSRMMPIPPSPGGVATAQIVSLAFMGGHLIARTAVLGRRYRSVMTCWAIVRDRKSTRLNSSHGYISYAVFCLKKKKKNKKKKIVRKTQKTNKNYRTEDD